ncbi:nitric oxide reductase [Desulfosarcina ovata subsp. sediminis]|uniref:Nitric oxide reductase n=1 Tax=Desulfosarcina ovata subsp. sediminis TaxID=885957 RepID=A0A5K7ZWT7_9BACT|nr:flavodoxin domain-containing protein [Desulfosarcina ovata]BBO84688.1 nitric oxide reductase [Desulfosarcina ovata subsp. sediminis]
MKPTQIADGIYDVGVIDWNIRDFHGYSTYRGSSYNAFLIIDEKVALIDTVKAPFADQLIGNISQIIDPKKIDVVVSNHTEMDHTGALPKIMTLVGADKPLYCSKLGAKNLAGHFPDKWNYHPVKDGEELSLGKRTLSFIETRMIHWPDSMFSYLKEDHILFSSDGFGQHYAGFEKFDDQADSEMMLQAKKYYANILMLYAPRILKLLEKVVASGIQIDMICPDHGVLWRKDPGKIIDAYFKWSRQETENKAVVVYDTMWKSTETMANAIAEGISSTGAMVKLIHIRSSHRSEIMTDVLDAAAVIVGSPTLNNQMFPTVADTLTYMKGLKPLGRIGGAFGSYGWSGEAVKMVAAELEAMKFTMIDAGPRLQYVPDKAGIEACINYGKKIGEAINAR